MANSPQLHITAGCYLDNHITDKAQCLQHCMKDEGMFNEGLMHDMKWQMDGRGDKEFPYVESVSSFDGPFYPKYTENDKEN